MSSFTALVYPFCSPSVTFIRIPPTLWWLAPSLSLLPPVARCCVWPPGDRERSLRGYQAEHLIKGPLMASLTDFLSNQPGSSGSFFSGSMFYIEPDRSPQGWRWSLAWASEHFPGRHICSPVTAPQLGISWCLDLPPWFLTTSSSVHFLASM